MSKEKVIEHLEKAHDHSPKDGRCIVEDCDECLKCTIFELIMHIEESEFFPH